MTLSRRALLQQFSLAGAGYAFAVPRHALADTGHETDWRWLVGNWDVWHERLRARLENSNTWDAFGGKCSCFTTLGGLGNVDDCLLYLPSGTYRALAPRAYDPATNTWSIWWLDGRMAGQLDPPVRGSFKGSEGEFQGPDVYKGREVTVRFRWHETHSKRPHWDQAYTTDEGKTWEINWRNYFTRTQATPSPVPLGANEVATTEAADWSFLVGHWRVRNRKLTPSGSWEEFDSTLHNWPMMGGLGNVGDNVFHAPSGTYRGLSVRAFDAEAKQWRSWWLDGRTPRDIAPAVAGGFSKGVGTLIGEAGIAGSKRQVRSQWSHITAKTARWEQATSIDGNRWETNWSADFERAGG